MRVKVAPMADAVDVQNYEDTPAGNHKRWAVELGSARKASEDWRKSGKETVKAFLDERDSNTGSVRHWPLFWSNVTTLQAMLYGKPPSVDVTRRFDDADDDVARVAGVILERLLNSDMDRDGDTYRSALRHALEDRLLPGICWARVRYELEEDEVAEVPAKLDADGAELAPMVPATTQKSSEDVEVDYLHWDDVMYSPCRVWEEIRWIAFRALMSRKQLIARFGEKLGKVIPLNAKKSEERKAETPWDRAEVWEIWEKDTERVFWVCEGYTSTLDEKPDPYDLGGFWPCPQPMIANSTTTSFQPRSDFAMAQDIYGSINDLTQRIATLTDAVRVTGVYDANAGDIEKMLDRGGRNKLYPVNNWAMFAEKGGIKSQIDWLPLEQIVSAIAVLSERRQSEVDALHEITGQSDIMRGAATVAGRSATESASMTRFGSVRVQHLQDELARYASDLQSLKAQLIAKQFDASTILERSNCKYTPDAALAPQAVELIKSRHSEYRIEVKPENISLTDFAALKSERLEVLGGLAQFFQAAAPIAQQMPGSMPFLLGILKWTVAGFRGASTIEGEIDRAIASSEKAQAAPQQPPAPDPKLLAQQMKGQQDLAKIQAQLAADTQLTQIEVQADAQREQNQAEWNTREAASKAQIQAASKAMEPRPPNGFRR